MFPVVVAAISLNWQSALFALAALFALGMILGPFFNSPPEHSLNWVAVVLFFISVGLMLQAAGVK